MFYALLEVYFLKVRVCLPIEESMFVRIIKWLHKSQSKECWLFTFYFWKLRFLKVQINLERNYVVLIIEGINHGDEILKNKD